MDNALISNETVSTEQGWCYAAKAPDIAANTAGESLMMAPESFGIEPYKFTVKETDKQLQLTRLMAFGRSFAGSTGTSWS